MGDLQNSDTGKGPGGEWVVVRKGFMEKGCCTEGSEGVRPDVIWGAQHVQRPWATFKEQHKARAGCARGEE